MAERPAILRGMRAADAVALALAAFVLATAPAHAASVVARDATDPSVDGGRLAWHAADGSGFVRAHGVTLPAPGPRAVVGGGRTAWIAGDAVHVRGGPGLAADLVVPAVGADSVAVGGRWVAWRAVVAGRDELRTARLPTGAPGPVAFAPPGRELGRPALSADTLLYHRTTAAGAIVRAIDLATGTSQTLRAEPGALLLNPAARGDQMVYVRSTYRRQQLRLGALAPAWLRPPDRVLHSTVPTGRRDRGYEPGGDRHTASGSYPRPPRGRSDTLWTTALGREGAYVTRLRQYAGEPVRATLLRVAR